MPTALEVEIRRQLARYIAGELPLMQFAEWFIPVLWTAAEGSEPATAELAAHIDLLLIEHSNGDRTEEELRGLLGPLIAERPYKV